MIKTEVDNCALGIARCLMASGRSSIEGFKMRLSVPRRTTPGQLDYTVYFDRPSLGKYAQDVMISDEVPVAEHVFVIEHVVKYFLSMFRGSEEY